MGEYQHLEHEFAPVFHEDSKILILGSFPSVKSREVSFYYGHTQNRFWKVIAQVVGADVPLTIPDKKELLRRNHIALWDVIQSCDIIGSSDSSIKNVEVTDLSLIIKTCNLQQIFVNGKTAEKLYHQYSEKLTNMKAVALPSTSPANAGYSIERLVGEWEIIREYIKENDIMKN
jgi:hypoxanthine-DNA glycosylase